MSSVVYHSVVGQLSFPLASYAKCNKHGNSVWAVCDCHPLYFANIRRKYTLGDVQYDDIEERREDFTSLTSAQKWADKEVKRLNK